MSVCQVITRHEAAGRCAGSPSAPLAPNYESLLILHALQGLATDVDDRRQGLDWYIFQNRNELYTDMVFAGLAVVILIGLLVENLVFDSLERVTVKRWGMQR